MTATDLIGLMAAFLTTFSFLPQAVQTIRSGDTRSISLPMYVMLCIGLVCWATYGIILQDPPLILANITTLVFALVILGVKIRNG